MSSSTDAARAPVRKIISSTQAAPAKTNTPKEVLIVVSKLKSYIRETSEMNTSESVIELLSDKVRELCDEAVANARADGRKTVMDRDF